MDITFDSNYRSKRSMFMLREFFYTRLVVIFMMIQEFFIGVFRIFVPKKPKSIKDKVALITGGGNGIGRAVAFKLAETGCHIVIADVDYDAAVKTVGEITEKYKVKAIPYKCDVSSYEEVIEMKKHVESSLGYVDLLINNAGLLAMDVSLREKTPQHVLNVLNTNLVAHLWTIRAFLDTMIERKSGHIVAMCSFSGKVSIPLGIIYCATKFGISGLMSALFDELCAFDNDDYVKTTTVYPYFIASRKDLVDLISPKLPLWSTEEVADATVEGILMDKRSVFVPDYIKNAVKVNEYPDRIIKFLKMRNGIKEIAKMRTSEIVIDLV